MTIEETGARAAGSGELLFAMRDGIAHVTFNRPEARNALTFAMYEGLAEICTAANSDRTVKAIVVTGAGDRAFAAGTDIAQFRDVRTAEDASAYEERIDRVLTAIETCRAPTIAAISGACTGGGAGIAACCDLRIGTASTRFGFPIARTLGNCLAPSTLARLAGLIGASLAKELIFTARLLEAEEAKAAGVLNEMVTDRAALDVRADELARLVGGHAPLTLQATKEGLRRIVARTVPPGDDLVAMCYTSSDFREGMEAFLEKRPARWTGT